MTEPPGRPGHGMRRNPEAKGRAGQYPAKKRLDGKRVRKARDRREGREGACLARALLPRLPRVFSPFAGAWGVLRSSPGILILCAAQARVPRPGVPTRPRHCLFFLLRFLSFSGSFMLPHLFPRKQLETVSQKPFNKHAFLFRFLGCRCFRLSFRFSFGD